MRGQGILVVGGRGAGKSVLLKSLAARLEDSGVRVWSIPHAPLDPSPEGFFSDLERALDIDGRDPREIVENALERQSPLAILLDEIDAWPEPDPLRHTLDILESIRKGRQGADLSLIAAGSARTLLLDRTISSAFRSRAAKYLLRPFTQEQVADRCAPFDGHAPIDDASQEALLHLGGGHPALTTWLLQHRWERPDLDFRVLATRFLRRHDGFIRAHRSSWAQGALEEPTLGILDLIDAHDGAIPLSELRGRNTEGADWKQQMELMAAAGVIDFVDAPESDPVHAWRIPSLLGPLPGAGDRPSSLPPLLGPLLRILRQVRVCGPDWFGQRGRIVQEKTFCAVIAVGMEQAGWRSAREPQRYTGRIDLLLEDASGNESVLEVKLWGRNDYRDIHEQTDGYRGSGGGDAVTLTITDSPEVTAEHYAARCLEGLDYDSLETPEGLEGLWKAGDKGAPVHHLLLRLPRRTLSSR